MHCALMASVIRLLTGRLRRNDDKPQLGAQLRIGEACSFQSFKTNNYKLHFMETLSGLKVGFLRCGGSHRAEQHACPSCRDGRLRSTQSGAS